MNTSVSENRYRRILLVASPLMRRTPAFERASWLAQTTGAELRISLTDYEPGIAKAIRLHPDEGAALRENYLLRRRLWLDEEADKLRACDIKVSTRIHWAKHLKDPLLAETSEWQADLVVKDVRHEALLQRILLRPLDWQLLRECPVPLLLVGTRATVAPRRVFAAIDVSGDHARQHEFNRQIIRQAQTLAGDSGAELHLMYVFALPAAVAGDLANGIYDGLLQTDRHSFDALKSEFGIADEKAHFIVGDPVGQLVDCASRLSADIIVLGVSQHPWVERLVLGTTAEGLLERCPCDVLTVVQQP